MRMRHNPTIHVHYSYHLMTKMSLEIQKLIHQIVMSHYWNYVSFVFLVTKLTFLSPHDLYFPCLSPMIALHPNYWGKRSFFQKIPLVRSCVYEHYLSTSFLFSLFRFVSYKPKTFALLCQDATFVTIFTYRQEEIPTRDENNTHTSDLRS